MMTKTEFTQSRFHMLTINDIVPETHLLRKIHSLVDFSFVYEQLEGAYCIGSGRPSIDPVVLIKMLLICVHATVLPLRQVLFSFPVLSW